MVTLATWSGPIDTVTSPKVRRVGSTLDVIRRKLAASDFGLSHLPGPGRTVDDVSTEDLANDLVMRIRTASRGAGAKEQALLDQLEACAAEVFGGRITDFGRGLLATVQLAQNDAHDADEV